MAGWVAVAAVAVKIAGQMQSANSKAAVAGAEGDAYKLSANQQRQRAHAIYQQGNQNEESQRREADIRLGQMRAMAAQSGTGLDGSSADVVGQSASNAELDARNIRYESGLAAQGALQQADMDMFAASMKKREAHSARASGWFSAIGTGLSSYAAGAGGGSGGGG